MTDHPLHLHLRLLHGRRNPVAGTGPEGPPPPLPPVTDEGRRSSLRTLLGLDRMAADVALDQPEAEVVERDRHEGFLRERVLLRTEPTVELPAWCLIPEGTGPFPVVITPHGHTHRGADQYIGVPHGVEDEEKIRTKRKDLALQAVRAGYLAVTPTTRGFAPLRYPDTLAHDTEEACHNQLVHCLLAGRTPLGERIWDLERLLDWVVTRPDCATDRIACVGHSGGGVLSWLLAAVDERVGLAVANEAFCPFVGEDMHMRFCACNTVPGLSRWGEIWDVAALIAPRSFVAISGTEGLYPHQEIDRAAGRTLAAFAERGAPGAFNHRYVDGPCRIFPEAIWPQVAAWAAATGTSGRATARTDADPGRTPCVELVPIDDANVRAFTDLELAESQHRFVKGNAVTVAQGLVSANGWLRGILCDGHPVGLMLVRTDEPEVGDHYLWRLMIDRSAQGRGIGSLAVAEAWRHLARRHVLRRIHVRYVMGPGSPRPFYLRNGFRDTGRTFGGDREMELVFS